MTIIYVWEIETVSLFKRQLLPETRHRIIPVYPKHSNKLNYETIFWHYVGND